jgi:hypothetical protein
MTTLFCRALIWSATALLPAIALAAPPAWRGAAKTWHPLTLDLAGPSAAEAGNPNPFRDVRFQVTLKHAEERLVVPGYFAADGDAANSGAVAGNLWRVHFVPTASGTWEYEVSLRAGKDVALSDDPQAGHTLPGDGLTGTLKVAADPDARGLLRYTGGRYLRFAGDGRWFLKAGADSPENFLAYVDFDGTYRDGQRSARAGEAKPSGLHTYQPHQRDWRPGDPTWKGGKGKTIIGALNYLASQGVNSVYFMTMNVHGDGQDVWPWTDPDQPLQFDCSKLDQWDIVFSHMDRLGIMLHVVLTETENESLFEVDEGVSAAALPFALRRKLYYRELIARFGHHRAIVWNLGEENGWSEGKNKKATPTKGWGRGNTDAQRKAFAAYIDKLDPYDRPIVVHTVPGQYDAIYRPLLGNPAFDGVSLQIDLGPKIHTETRKWIVQSRAAGRPWFAMLDEIGPADTGVKPDADDPDHDAVRHFALWGNLMAGGAGCEWYFGYKYAHNDLNLEDFRSRARMWEQTHYAIEFFHRYLPFTQMASADKCVTASNAYCFARPGDVYAVYLPAGVQTQLSLPEADFTVKWFNPRAGGPLANGTVTQLRGGGFRNVGLPPADPQRDWVALVRRVGAARESRTAEPIQPRRAASE